MVNYMVHYEISVGTQVIEDEMIVQAVSEARAVEFAEEMLDQLYDENSVLLVCEVVGTRE